MSNRASPASVRLNFVRSGGFTLLELMITVAIVAILARISFSAYTRSVTKSRRVAAEACLASYASYMERYYVTNLRYDQDAGGTPMSNTVLSGLSMPCAAASATGQYYSYSFTTTPTQSAYQVQAVPSGSQATLDAQCGTLSVDQTGARYVTGSSPVTTCWPQ
jgi:type IV pilus assembly protein PilE